MNNPWHEIIVQFRIEPVGTAMPGPRLPKRVRKIIELHSFARISRRKVALLVGTCVALCAALIVVTLTRAQSSGAQDWEKAAGGKMSFDVTSVKQNSSGRGVRPNFPLDDSDSYSGDTTLLSSTGLPLTSYIGFA